MKEFVIMTDSCCDLSNELVNELNIEVVPMSLFIDDKEYKHYPDCRELSMDEFYSKIQAGHIGKTSCVNIMDVENVMRKYAEKDMDILYLSFSTGMSSSWQSAVLAANDIKTNYPDCDVRVIDTLSGSSGLGMLTYLAVKEKEKGKTLDETAEFVMKNRLNISHYFMVEDLMYIQKAGRLSSTSAVLGAIIGVKPIFKLDDGGRVALVKKKNGKKNAIKYLVEEITKAKNSDVFFVCHAKAEKEVNELYNRIKELYPNATIKINEIGPVVGNNTGPGTIAVMFLGER